MCFPVTKSFLSHTEGDGHQPSVVAYQSPSPVLILSQKSKWLMKQDRWLVSSEYGKAARLVDQKSQVPHLDKFALKSKAGSAIQIGL